MSAGQSWPNAIDFAKMMQDPKRAFRDPKLQRVTIHKDPVHVNQPRVWSGQFANVYRATDPQTGRSMAIRVFTSARQERQERYEAVARYLKTHLLNSLVHFEFQEGGVRSASDGKWYPLVVMDWVPGQTLYKWVRAKSLAKDRRALGHAATLWVQAIDELKSARIAHGDLQHGNVMVVDNGKLALKFVDYDGMYVPSLEGRRNLEVGLPPYQHPQRNGDTLLGPNLDNFSALFILAALRALAAAPDLWDRYVEGDGYENLLFRKRDLDSPADSSLIQEVTGLSNGEFPGAPELCESLLELRRGDIGNVQDLDPVFFACVESLLKRKRDQEALRFLTQVARQLTHAPRPLQSRLQEAQRSRQREQALAKLKQVPQAVNEQNDRKLVEAWDESLFAGWPPAESERKRVAAAAERRQRVQQICGEISGTRSPQGEKRIAQLAGDFPSGYFSEKLRRRVQWAIQWTRLYQQLQRALQGSGSDSQIWAAWSKLDREGRKLVPREHHPRIRQAQERFALLAELNKIPPDYPPREADKYDPALLKAFNNDVLAGCPEAKPWQEAYKAAKQRQAARYDLNAAIRAKDNQRIVEVLKRWPKGYPLPEKWKAAVRTAREDVRAVQGLQAGLKNNDPSRFHQVFDVRILRRNATAYRPYESRLAEWIRAEILPRKRIGLALPPARQAVVQAGDLTSCRLRWRWPKARFNERCIVGVCKRSPPRTVNQDPYEVALEASCRWVDRKAFQQGGGELVFTIRDEWLGGYVVVWAAVELRFGQFRNNPLFSEPLVLGRLR